MLHVTCSALRFAELLIRSKEAKDIEVAIDSLHVQSSQMR
jgi:hypothetical protein